MMMTKQMVFPLGPTKRTGTGTWKSVLNFGVVPPLFFHNCYPVFFFLRCEMRQRLLDLQAERKEIQRTMVKDRLVHMDVEVEPKEQYVLVQKNKILLFLFISV